MMRDKPVSPRVAKLIKQAEQLWQLPDDYVDVSTGRFGRLKRWLKAKLLHNFRVAYVNAISRQQTRFNQKVLDAIAELAAERDRVAATKEEPKRSERQPTIPLREAS